MAKYELYHDESKVGGYWHGMLLVPVKKKEFLLEYLEKVRRNNNYTDPINLKKVSSRGRVFGVADSWIQIGVGFLRSSSKSKKYPVFLGKRIKNRYTYDYLNDYCTGLKFILFRKDYSNSDMRGYPDDASKVETIFRMGLKGGLNFLGNDENPIHVDHMHFDGYEHYQRHLDRKRISDRLMDLRDYCFITDHEAIIDDRSSDHRLGNSQFYEDCQLLQLTDLLVGSFRTALGITTRDIHNRLAYPVRELIKKYSEGYARMRNSRWFNSYCLSNCYLENGHWKFSTFDITKENVNEHELPLFSNT